MIVAIHQPQYLPWLGYFDKIAQADIFILLDDVQFKKNEWQNRNRIRVKDGWQWLTVPVLHNFGQPINEVLINNDVGWRNKHLNSLAVNYSHARYFSEYIDFFKEAYACHWQKLSEINIYFIKAMMKFLGLKTKLIVSSELNAEGESSARLINICKMLKSDTYLAGAGGCGYMDMKMFEKEKINVLTQDFQHPVYDQCWPKDVEGFEPFMSVVDLLFNCGKNSLEIITSGRRNQNV